MNTLNKPDIIFRVPTWVEPLARVGYGINGMTYIVVGLLALRAALYRGDPGVGRADALFHIVTAPFGPVLLTVVGLGLVAYALGHGFMALRSPAKDKKSGLSSLFNRAAHLVGAGVHASLALTALRLAVTGLMSSENAPRDWTARALSEPWGRWLVILASLAIFGVSVYEFYKAYTANFREVFNGEVSDGQAMSGTVVGRVGYTARGVIYLVIGIFLFRAGWQYDPSEAGGLGKALAALADQPYYGAWLLAAMGLGLLSYGVFGVFIGKYREFNF